MEEQARLKVVGVVGFKGDSGFKWAKNEIGLGGYGEILACQVEQGKGL